MTRVLISVLKRERQLGAGRRARALATAVPLLALAAIAAAPSAGAGDWLPLDQDELHDPAGPAVRILQPPREALSNLPPDTAGNQVRWMDALEQGLINPRTTLRSQTKVNVYDKDVLLNLYGSTHIVRFPHYQHTLWLDCSNCHEQLFKSEAGATRISMFAILEGEQCGVCHGAVSFPLTECARCHSVPWQDVRPARNLRAIVVPRGELPVKKDRPQ